MVTRNNFVLYQAYQNEPKQFWKIYFYSSIACLVLLWVSAGVAYFDIKESAAGDDSIAAIVAKEPTINCDSSCKTQHDYWVNYKAEMAREEDIVKERIVQVKEGRFDKQSEFYDKDWNWFQSELKILNAYKSRVSSFEVKSIRDGFFYALFPAILISLLIYLLVARAAYFHADSIKLNIPPLGDRSYLYLHIRFAILISGLTLFSEYMTSVDAVEKTAFGYASYCVNSAAFGVKMVALVFFGFAAAAPFTVLWGLTDKSHIPPPNTSGSDGRYGVGPYTDFLHAWALWLILSPAVLGIMWLKIYANNEIEFSLVRLLHGTGVAILIVLIVARMIRNALILRNAIRGVSVSENADDKKHIDPTITFIGEQWWITPATIGATLVLVWS